MLMANAVSQLAAKTPGKEAAAMEAFAAALRQVHVKLVTIFMYLQDENFNTDCHLITYNPAVTLSDLFVQTSHRTCITAFIAELTILFKQSNC